jgi:3,4-dihydroxy 2-butanone 4-phosphate synthase/GTP cyclohydrolase II
VRVHEPLSVVDLLDAEAGGHSWSLPQALQHIAAAGRGVAVLLRRPDGSTGLLQRVESALEPAEPAKFDLRNYGIGAQILADLGVRRMRLMAKRRKIPSMAGFGLEVAGFVAPSGLSEPPL